MGLTVSLGYLFTINDWFMNPIAGKREQDAMAVVVIATFASFVDACDGWSSELLFLA